jgi:hypothetical protein
MSGLFVKRTLTMHFRETLTKGFIFASVRMVYCSYSMRY